MIIKALYNISIRLYAAAIHLAAPFHLKARAWRDGRRGWLKSLRSDPDFRQGEWVWVHCASLGEFEQGRPLIEALRGSVDCRILLTFFSPSGYLPRKDYPLADKVCYLPLDTPHNAKAFLEAARPSVAVFVRYEFWFHFLNELRRKDVPTFLISASFRPQQLFFRPLVGVWFRRMLHFYKKIYTIDKESVHLLDFNRINNTVHAGDTRADRVRAIAATGDRIPIVESFKGKAPLLVAGSTWPIGERLLSDWMVKVGEGVKIAIAPHEIDKGHIQNIIGLFGNKAVRYSEWQMDASAQVLIMDNIGMLSRLYAYADVAYVGGGFGKGVHNVLEPAVFGVPVLFGPKYGKFPEALGLLRAGGGFEVGRDSLAGKLDALFFGDGKQRCVAGKAAAVYVSSMSGATNLILNDLMHFLQKK